MQEWQKAYGQDSQKFCKRTGEFKQARKKKFLQEKRKNKIFYKGSLNLIAGNVGPTSIVATK